ncbi:MAG: hypothetical protein KFF50_00610 [Desulfatitalea sp.]|nr:hypothetical protein [Desulfatitalea sp.]
MAHRLHIPNTMRRQPAGPWDAERQLADALRDRAAFLEKFPQYREMQNDIDTMLDKAGTVENRMAVLALLMEAKLLELQGQLGALNRIVRRLAERRDS